MLTLIREAQLALGALSTLFSLIPDGARGRVTGVLDSIGAALQTGANAIDTLPRLAEEFRGLRADIEAALSSANRLTESDLARALLHLESASTRFRSAIVDRQSVT